MVQFGSRVGLIGVGNMGGRIGARMHETGTDIVGFHRDPARVSRWGLDAVGSIAELTRGADIVVLCLPDSPAVESVVTGPDGVLSAARPGQLVIDMTSALPASTRRLAGLVGAEGVHYLDAPVSGGARSVAGGKLTLMVGGERADLDAVRWLLERVSSGIHYMGPSGSGHLTKILNNFLNSVSLAASSEAMVGARSAGLDMHEFLDVLSTSSGRNYAIETRFPHILEGDYPEGGITVDLMIKEVASYLDVAAELHLSSSIGSGAMAAFRLASILGYGDQINSRVVDAVGDAAGGVRIHS